MFFRTTWGGVFQTYDVVASFTPPWPGSHGRRCRPGRCRSRHSRGPGTPAAGQQTGYQKFVDALAQRLGTTTAKLETAIGQARGDAGLPTGGQGFPGAGRGGHGKGGRGAGVDLNAAATAIGITPQQLRTELAGKSLADVAKAHGKTAADVTTALKNAAHTSVDQAVTAGKIAADQAATQKTQADTRIDQLVNQVMPVGGPGGRGPEGPGGGRGGFGADLNAAATAIGITPQQLRTEVAGKSLADVAKAHGKTAADVTTALKTAAHTRIDQAVTAGRLTADQATAQKTQVDTRIDQQINQVVPQKGAGTPGADTEDPAA
jgi:polyhydroxyalkanoate synthesis regulator phasin